MLRHWPLAQHFAVKQERTLFSRMNSAAFFSFMILQSMHGLIPRPCPCFGLPDYFQVVFAQSNPFRGIPPSSFTAVTTARAAGALGCAGAERRIEIDGMNRYSLVQHESRGQCAVQSA